MAHSIGKTCAFRANGGSLPQLYLGTVGSAGAGIAGATVGIHRSLESGVHEQLPRRYRLGNYVFEPATGSLSGEFDSVSLRPKVARLLQLLIEASPGTISREELTELIWPDTHVAPGSLPRIVSELRDALKDEREAIQTLPRRGYQLCLDISEVEPASAHEEHRPCEPGEWDREQPGMPARRMVARPGIAFVAVLLAIAAAMWWQSQTNASSAPAAAQREYEIAALRRFQAGYRSWGLWDALTMRDALDQFAKTARGAPDLWFGYAGMADAYIGQILLASEPQPNRAAWAEQAARKATELGPRVAAAHCALGTVKFVVDWDWNGADASFAKALECNPFSYVTYQRRGVLRTLQGQFDLAEADLRRAMELQPEHSDAIVFLGWSRYCAGDYHGALRVLAQVPVNPGKRRECYRIQAATHGMLGNFDAARAALGRAGLSEEDHLAAQAWLDAAAGDRNASLVGLKQLHELRRKNGSTQCDAPAAYTALGDHDEAFASLAATASARHWKALLALVDPRFEALHTDPRWHQFVAEVRGGRNPQRQDEALPNLPEGIRTAPPSTRSVSNLHPSRELR